MGYEDSPDSGDPIRTPECQKMSRAGTVLFHSQHKYTNDSPFPKYHSCNPIFIGFFHRVVYLPLSWSARPESQKIHPSTKRSPRKCSYFQRSKYVTPHRIVLPRIVLVKFWPGNIQIQIPNSTLFGGADQIRRAKRAGIFYVFFVW